MVCGTYASASLDCPEEYGGGRKKRGFMNPKTYEYETVICAADAKGGAYVAFPYDIRAEFGKGRVKVHATFDGEPYDGSVVNMGVKNADGSICYLIGIRKEIRLKIGKQPGDKVLITVRERESTDANQTEKGGLDGAGSSGGI